MTHIIIPDWVPPIHKPVDATGQAKPSSLNSGSKGSTPADLQVQTLGRDQIIPILYGGPERMAGLIYCVATPKAGTVAGTLVFAAILCEGPVESITQIEVNGDPLPPYIAVHTYTGAPGQPVDPWLAAAIPGFNETLPGVAYIVAKVSKHDAGFPALTALVKGLKLKDPRVTFYHVESDLLTGWADVGGVGYSPNSRVARDGTMTAHSLMDLDANPATPAHRDWTWVVPNDALSRRISISINKEIAADHSAGVGVAYTGGVTPRSYVVSLDLVTGATALVSGAGGTVNVVDHPNHWEVLISLANNTTGNTAFVLSLYPDI